MSSILLHRAKSTASLLRTISPSLIPTQRQALSFTARSSGEGMNKTKQGHATNPKNLHPQDVESQSIRGGFRAKKGEKNEGMDSAKIFTKGGRDEKPRDVGKGNPEGVGFVEQVGSASATARKFETEKKK